MHSQSGVYRDWQRRVESASVRSRAGSTPRSRAGSTPRCPTPG